MSLTSGIDQVRTLLVDGPLQVDPVQVDRIRDTAVSSLQTLVPQPVGGATTALRLLGAGILVLFAVFFLLKDGPQMWRWFLGWVPVRRRVRTDVAGHAAWDALSSYARGTVLIALADATLIGAGLLVLSVPLWLSLTLLTFLGAFVPLLGATVADAAAVLVTFVTNGISDAVIVLVIVIAVQQIESNLLQPFVMGHALSLHIDAVTLEGEGGPGEVQAPDARPTQGRQLHRLVPVAVQAFDPRPAREGVVPAQGLDVAHLEPRPLQDVDVARQRLELAVGEDVPGEERARVRPFGAGGGAAGDGVVEQPASRPQHRVQPSGKRRQLVRAVNQVLAVKPGGDSGLPLRRPNWADRLPGAGG